MPDPRPDHPAALPKGASIAEYEIVRVLGAGGFGITYLAFDHQLDGPVAIKEYFPAELATRVDGDQLAATAPTSRSALVGDKSGTETFAWGLERFLDEARAIHRFRHPNVVQARRYLEANGTAYLVMEYVEGESLKAILDRRGSLPAEEWRRWMDALLNGLEHVHSHGYLHRDIKPANIVIRSEDGEPVLIDFGSARLQHRDRTHTQVLSAAYAPIEQHSTGATQGPPTDIYALAATSYRALTGTLVPSVPDRILNDDYEPLARGLSGTERQWLAAIDDGLAVKPQNRPQTVEEWRTKLARTAASRSTMARRSTGAGGAQQKPSDGPPETADLTVEAGAAPTRDSVDAPSRPGRAVAALGALLLFGAVLTVALLTTKSPRDGTPDPEPLGEPSTPAAAARTEPEKPAQDSASVHEPPIQPPAPATAEQGARSTVLRTSADAEAGDAGDSGVPHPEPTGGEENDADAQYLLGERHYYGDGTAQDYGAAVESYRKAADQGHAAAQFSLGFMYFHGQGVPKDGGEAAVWYRKAADQGHAGAQSSLGWFYGLGLFVPKDEAESAAWYRRAADQGYAETERKRAEQGHAQAQFQLAFMYDHGQGVPTDKEEAVAWYRKAADQGHAVAQFRLAYKHLLGEGVPTDRGEGAAWIRKAADQGYAEAQFSLGSTYRQEGWGVPKHQTEAASWYRKAADQGHAAAQVALAGMYDDGEGVTQDYGEALALYRKAANQGRTFAQWTLGMRYRDGVNGAQQNYVRAYAWLSLAAASGDGMASDAMGRLRKEMTREQIAEAEGLAATWSQ